MTEDIIDEIVSLAATQIDAALDSGSSHASDMKYLVVLIFVAITIILSDMIYRSFGSK